MNETSLVELFASTPIAIVLLAPLPIMLYLTHRTLRSKHPHGRFAALVLLIFLSLVTLIPWVFAALIAAGVV